MNKISFLFLGLLLTATILFALPSKAFCPVCTIAVGLGVGLSRWLKVDDLLSGAWIGGLVVSMILWTEDWLSKKKINFNFSLPAIAVFYYLIIILPLYFTGIMGHPLNQLWGIDKLLLGIIAGSLVFLLSVGVNSFLKKKNQGKVYFPYQKVVLPVSFLIIISLIFYILLKWQK